MGEDENTLSLDRVKPRKLTEWRMATRQEKVASSLHLGYYGKQKKYLSSWCCSLNLIVKLSKFAKAFSSRLQNQTRYCKRSFVPYCWLPDVIVLEKRRASSEHSIRQIRLKSVLERAAENIDLSHYAAI